MQFSKRRFDNIEEAILKTLAYSDIFDFPLTKQELWRCLISYKKIEKNRFEKALTGLINFEIFDVFNAKKQVIYKDGFFCLGGREDIISRRRKNKLEVRKKLTIAEKAAYYLSFIPSIKYIGVSGGLAIGNADKEDDIDFFIITKKHTLFITRLWILMLLELLSLRRKRNETNAPNKICVNFLIDEDNLSWHVSKRDLYVAHEIIQMRTLFERNGMHERFIENNNWVKFFFPNFKKNSFVIPVKMGIYINKVLDSRLRGNDIRNLHKTFRNNYLTLRFISIFIFFWPFEVIIRNIQKYYMKKHKTTETVSNGLLAFHPNDYRIKTMEILSSKWEKLGLLTNL